MTFAELISYQHTRLQVPDINEKKIRKVFDDMIMPQKKTRASTAGSRVGIREDGKKVSPFT